MVKVKWIRSWRELPAKVREPGVRAYHDPGTDIIYAIKGVTTKSELEHEKFHSKKRHPDYPRNPLRFVQNEILAYLYAYNRTGRPRHLLVKLRGLHNDLVLKYRLNSRQATATIKKVVARLPRIPKSWVSDVKELERHPPVYIYK